MNSKRRLEIAQAWVTFQKNWWAYDSVNKVCLEQPEDAWLLLQELVEMAETRRILEDVGAGPLEDFVRQHGEQYIGKIETLVGKNPRFKKALGVVWIRGRGMRQNLAARFIALGCQDLDNSKSDKSDP